MAGADMSDEALVAFLRGHRDLRNRVASIALAVENADGDLDEADAAEERLVEEMRHLGREALQGWAEKQGCSVLTPACATCRKASLSAGVGPETSLPWIGNM